ncbi:glucans biosynthesis glucosyltransferase MdoH [Alteromonas australica]|uniref:Glucans biosynthesis glucosyltransferase H n=4 Tax=Alteromonas australica TaxID=589873 RepID=A0A075P0X6_9ALTE|nr:glucans biosynthesis glucosyltransferase MdoH [Alteromonas australica]AIG00540.1 glucosyl transferase family 2 [Alteromonas australica]MAB93493.1 glucans biosynthesis glucosyltransferase MdoH [Alteromonas sp.]|tara:strand:+ start:557 stop:2539 length:1983 start_codon:yes stop_codon:yes gene_type:complete
MSTNHSNSLGLQEGLQTKKPSTDASSTHSHLNTKGEHMRLFIMAMLVIPSTALAGWSLYEIFLPNGLTNLEIAQLGLGLTLFAWLCMAFWTGIIGFVLQLFNIDPLSLRKKQCAPDQDSPLVQKHAVVMPVYNEDTRRIMVGFEACVREIMGSTQAEQFDFFMLSDTRDEQKAEAELRAWNRMTKRLGQYASHVFYRRREENSHRKVGNLKDFCERWGANYESMIVLDADSIMSGERMLDLARRIEQNPDTALVQTIPMPVRQDTFFGRFVQFAAHLYSPMLATGLSFWQTDSANYWGHNAIIRIAPFMQHCGLPTLEGRAPFGGEVLSHDFVEAALLRRAGWQAYLLTDTTGSYEEVPSNIVDYAIRDRRWVQGNIQHLGLLKVKGLKTANRLHFLFGAFAYISSLVLFCMLALGTADALIRATSVPDFFVSEYQLFPSWQVARQDMMMVTMWGTAALLFLPKLLGITLALIKRRSEFGGAFSLLKSAILELVMAVLIAPLMMFYHSYFVISVFIGHSVKWEAQEREGRKVPWSVAFKHTQIMSCLAVIWGVTTFYYTPSLFMWLLPVLIGMVLAAPIIRLSSSTHLGVSLRNWGVFVIDQEVKECMALKRLRVAMNYFSISQYKAEVPALPDSLWVTMPEQALHQKPLPMQGIQQQAA